MFPKYPDDRRSASLLLVARIVFSILLMTHGFQKISHFSELAGKFPDPIGWGCTVSLSLAVFAEFICPLGVICGLFYRLALLPMMFTMGVATWVIHHGDPFSDKELSLVYLLVFLLLFFCGPGRYSVDYLIGKKIT